MLSYLPHHRRKMGKDELRSHHFEWQTQWPAAFICAAVKKLRLFRYHTLWPPPPPFLPPSCPRLRSSVRDWFLPRGTFCSLQTKASGAHICDPLPESLHFTVFWSEYFPKEITNQSKKNLKDVVPVPSSESLSARSDLVTDSIYVHCCYIQCSVHCPSPGVMHEH